MYNLADILKPGEILCEDCVRLFQLYSNGEIACLVPLGNGEDCFDIDLEIFDDVRLTDNMEYISDKLYDKFKIRTFSIFTKKYR